ncbi:hypothetical protein IH992_17710 [Candidatus Poribacteria bacterium]|nr:hypothetical protein [Candidatus Poribacteria bacterium]
MEYQLDAMRLIDSFLDGRPPAVKMTTRTPSQHTWLMTILGEIDSIWSHIEVEMEAYQWHGLDVKSLWNGQLLAFDKLLVKFESFPDALKAKANFSDLLHWYSFNVYLELPPPDAYHELQLIQYGIRCTLECLSLFSTPVKILLDLRSR